ncbi:MAG: hypothetical protein FJY85_24625, partial [Deltaproteobacteria bacterium]|nr:hypothetical protein [Deltaproteobacteria bacterium]
MKVMTLYLVVVVTCLGTLTVAVAQALAESGKPLTESLPPEVCKGIEAYVARIDTAKSMREPSKRAELYTAAKADLEPVMKQYNKT